jgi:putative redox protein
MSSFPEHVSTAAAARPGPAAVRLEVVSSPPTVKVAHRGEDRFEIRVRDHLLVVDQPISAGGEDVGPTPTELFVAGLASCVAFYARRYLARHGLEEDGLAVAATYHMAAKPNRVSGIEITVQVPERLEPARRDALMAVARHCTVHNSIELPPAITIELE